MSSQRTIVAKTERLEERITLEQKDLIRKAAGMLDLSERRSHPPTLVWDVRKITPPSDIASKVLHDNQQRAWRKLVGVEPTFAAERQTTVLKTAPDTGRV